MVRHTHARTLAAFLIKHGTLRHTWWEPGRASLVWQFRCTDLPARSEQVKEKFGTDPPGRFDQLPPPRNQRAGQHAGAYITAEGIPCYILQHSFANVGQPEHGPLFFTYALQ